MNKYIRNFTTWIPNWVLWIPCEISYLLIGTPIARWWRVHYVLSLVHDPLWGELIRRGSKRAQNFPN